MNPGGSGRHHRRRCPALAGSPATASGLLAWAGRPVAGDRLWRTAARCRRTQEGPLSLPLVGWVVDWACCHAARRMGSQPGQAACAWSAWSRWVF